MSERRLAGLPAAGGIAVGRALVFDDPPALVEGGVDMGVVDDDGIAVRGESGPERLRFERADVGILGSS